MQDRELGSRWTEATKWSHVISMDRAPVHKKLMRFARSMDRASSFPPPVRLSPPSSAIAGRRFSALPHFIFFSGELPASIRHGRPPLRATAPKSATTGHPPLRIRCRFPPLIRPHPQTPSTAPPLPTTTVKLSSDQSHLLHCFRLPPSSPLPATPHAQPPPPSALFHMLSVIFFTSPVQVRRLLSSADHRSPHWQASPLNSSSSPAHLISATSHGQPPPNRPPIFRHLHDHPPYEQGLLLHAPPPKTAHAAVLLLTERH